MDEKWAVKCVDETMNILSSKIPGNPGDIAGAAKEICIDNLNQAMNGVILSVISLSFSLATLFLGYIKFDQFQPAKKIIVGLTTAVSLGTGIWGVVLIGSWYSSLALGGGLLLTVVYFCAGLFKSPPNSNKEELGKPTHTADKAGTLES